MSKPLLDPAYQQKVIDKLNERHGAMLRNERFTLEARKEGEDAIVRVTLESFDRTHVYWMEAAVRREQYHAMTLAASIDVELDFLDWYIGEYFREERDAFLPLDWKVFRFGDMDVLARGEVRNAFLDDAADAWLRGERPDIETQYKQLKQRH